MFRDLSQRDKGFFAACSWCTESTLQAFCGGPAPHHQLAEGTFIQSMTLPLFFGWFHRKSRLKPDFPVITDNAVFQFLQNLQNHDVGRSPVTFLLGVFVLRSFLTKWEIISSLNIVGDFLLTLASCLAVKIFHCLLDLMCNCSCRLFMQST